MKRKIIASVVNFRHDYNFDNCFSNILRAIKQARKSDIIVFPEKIVGFPKNENDFTEKKGIKNSKVPLKNAEIPNQYTEHISDFCKRYNLHVVLGCVERVKRKIFNSSILFTPKTIHRYRKTHLVFHEPKKIAYGNLGFPVFKTSLGRIGLCICYDIEFPETTRILRLNGAEIICVSASWPKYDAYGWDIVTRVRARENEVFLICAGQFGFDSSKVMKNGHSRIIDPTGKIMVEVKTNKKPYQIATIVLDSKLLDVAKTWRGRNTEYIANRRPEIYKEICSRNICKK